MGGPVRVRERVNAPQWRGGVASGPGSENAASLGCERVSRIVDMGSRITLKEGIVDYEEGRSYRYEVYEWSNFPIEKMQFGFTARGVVAAPRILALDIETGPVPPCWRP